MVNIFLIANNPNINIFNMKKINYNQDDIIVRFNHMDNFKLFNGKTDILFIRFKNPVHFKIRNSVKKYNKLSSFDLNYIGKYELIKNLLIEKNINEKKNLNNYRKYIHNHLGYSPSTGFIAISYLINNFKLDYKKNIDNIFLVGFTFHKNEQKNHYWHNFDLEEKIINNFKNDYNIVYI